MITVQHNVESVRSWFRELKSQASFVDDKTGCRVLEVVGATFIADESTIFGKVNEGYVERELEWYYSKSLNVNDIPGGAPTTWKQCATPDGFINSNYGNLVWSDENHKQYVNVAQELANNPDSRRAVMIYTRPSMWNEYNRDGMSDFICTNAVQYLIRGSELIAIVQMRSNDVWAGFRNDKAWQDHVHQKLANDLGYHVGPMVWHAGSLHCYERNFYLIDAYVKTGRSDFTKAEWELWQQMNTA